MATNLTTHPDGLTAAQREAIEHVDGPLLVLAGPGSGKTTVVTRRVANLLARGVPAWQILALTFTNKAAGEMRERVEALVPGQRGLTITTFHSFCARLLRRWAEEAQVPAGFSIYDGAAQRAAIKEAIRAADLDHRNWAPATMASAISDAKNRLKSAAACAGDAGDFFTRCVARVYAAYEKILRANDALDFDDLLLATARLLRGGGPARRELQERLRYVLVDEYQDTNHAQFVIASAIAAAHRNLCVVGDPDQSIYGWRGADIRNILEFEDQYPEASVIPLGQNFRSTAHIVRAADHLIRHNAQRKHKPLHTELGEGIKPAFILCRDEEDEAHQIVQAFRRLHREDRVAWKDMAVLYRINALSRVLEEAFRRAEVPYVIARGTAFYDRAVVKDALAYLRLIANPRDEIALRRIINTPPRGIGRTTLERIEAFAVRQGVHLAEALPRVHQVEALTARSAAAVARFAAMCAKWRTDAAASMPRAEDAAEALAEYVRSVLLGSGLESRHAGAAPADLECRENLGELISAAARFIPPAADGPEPAPPPALLDRLRGFLESVSLVSDADVIDPASGTVTLLTLHAAKGLEFDAVAIAGLEDGLLPHSRADTSPEQLEEERRLCFVGLTRARRHLLLTRAVMRTSRGIMDRTIESRFIGELPPDSLARSGCRRR